MTGTTTVTRESPWDLESQEWALQFHAWSRMIHPRCGGHLDKTHDDTVARDVNSFDDVCLDCQAIDAARAIDHKNAGHKGEAETCDKCTVDKVYYVAKYVPKQDRGTPDW